MNNSTEIPTLNVLAFFAHPDDETMLAGGILALLAQAGVQVHYLCATRGEGGEAGEPPLCTLDELGQFRQAEMACAVQTLRGASLTFLDYVDPRVGPDEQLFVYSDDLPGLSAHLVRYMRRFEIDVLITHGVNGEYGHPAHTLSHQAARRAIEALDEREVLFYNIGAAFPDHPRPRLANQDQPAHMVLDIDPVLALKTQAALCHRTQHALFVRRSSREAGRQLSVPEVIMRVESLHRVSPAVNGRLEDPFAQLLRPWERAAP